MTLARHAVVAGLKEGVLQHKVKIREGLSDAIVGISALETCIRGFREAVFDRMILKGSALVAPRVARF